MPTKKKRLNIVMDDWMVDAVEGYKARNNIASTSQAAVNLIELGLKQQKAPIQKPEIRKLDETKIRKHLQAIDDILSSLEKGSSIDGRD